MSLSLICKARAFAIKAHGDQKRLYTGEPYWHHCRDVADILYDLPFVSEKMIAAAWLHDVVEDTFVSIDEIHRLFGVEVASTVSWLSKRYMDEALTLRLLEDAAGSAQTVKVADIIDNCSTLRVRAPGRVATYFARKREQLKVMTWADPGLLKTAWSIVGVR